MCYYKAGYYSFDDLEVYYQFKGSEDVKSQFQPHYYENGYDHLLSPVMIAPGEVRLYSWGLIPWRTKDLDAALAIRNQTLNAKSEEMFEKPSYHDSLRDNKRCLIPATGFYEWKWNDPKGKEKQPYHIKLKDKKLFSFAGIWSTWKNKSNNTVAHTYSILTTQANPLMAEIHNNKKRMPVIIPDEYLKDWLNPNLSKEDVLAFCKPYNQNIMEAWPIDKRIGAKISSEEKDTAKVQQKIEIIPATESRTETKIKVKKTKGDPGQSSLF
jgi:putative SOS response-associated peptidase YedK